MLQPPPLRIAFALPLTASLAACGLLDPGTIERTCEDLPQGCDDKADGGAGDSGAAAVDIAVTSVDPEYGPAAGGTQVTITGGPFASDATVWFGDAEATVQSWTDTGLVVDTPDAPAEGWVDVTVRTAEGEGTLARAFRYFEDHTGEARLLGSFGYTHSVGSLSSAGDLAQATVQFVSPDADLSWWSTITSGLDTCERNWDDTPSWAGVDPGADVLTITRSDGETIDLAWKAAENSFNGIDGDGDVPTDLLQPETIWSITSFESDDLPTFGLSGLAVMPPEFNLSSPELDKTSARLKEQELYFYWDPGGADAVIIQMQLVDGNTGTEVERVSCAVSDTGRFHVPSETFQMWEPGLFVYVKIGFGTETRAEIDLDGSESRVLSTYLLSAAAIAE